MKTIVSTTTLLTFWEIINRKINKVETTTLSCKNNTWHGDVVTVHGKSVGK